MSANRFEPNVQRREDLRKLAEFVATLADGRRVSYVEFEQATAVKMDLRGRALLRLACKRSKRPYLSLLGHGVELSSPQNGMEIVDKCGCRVVSALTAAREVTELVSGRHAGEMTQEDRNRLSHRSAVFATVELSTSLAKKPARRLSA